MSDVVYVPFSPAQVESLNAFQDFAEAHPFTCGEDSSHPNLVAREDGWHCIQSGCPYRQAWAHAFMANGSWRNTLVAVLGGPIGRHPFTPSLLDPKACYRCPRAADDAVHAASRYDEVSPPIVEELPSSAPMGIRMAEMHREREAVLDREENRNEDRIRMARDIARRLYFATMQPIMVWQIHDYWRDNVKSLSWEDERGRTYWAGAIFRGKEWVCVGAGTSPYNHNDSNKKWQLRDGERPSLHEPESNVVSAAN